jgi:hypothetical protein
MSEIGNTYRRHSTAGFEQMSEEATTQGPRPEGGRNQGSISGKCPRHQSRMTAARLSNRRRGHLVLNPRSRKEVHELAEKAWTHEDDRLPEVPHPLVFNESRVSVGPPVDSSLIAIDESLKSMRRHPVPAIHVPCDDESGLAPLSLALAHPPQGRSPTYHDLTFSDKYPKGREDHHPSIGRDG